MPYSRKKIESLLYDGEVLIVYKTTSKLINEFIFDSLEIKSQRLSNLQFIEQENKLCRKLLYVELPIADYENNDPLKQLNVFFKMIIDFSIANKVKQIGFPFLHLEVNNFDKNLMYEAIVNASYYLRCLENKGELLSFEILDYYIDLKRAPSYYCNFYDYVDTLEYPCEISRNACMSMPEDYEENVDNYSKDIEDENSIVYMIKKFSDIVDYEYYKPKRFLNFMNPFDYVISYIDDHDLSEKKVLNCELDRRRKNQLKKQNYIKKRYIYLLAFLLGLNYTELVEFMVINGSSFSPINQLDIFMFNYFKDEEYIEDELIDFLDKVYYTTGIYLSFNIKN